MKAKIEIFPDFKNIPQQLKDHDQWVVWNGVPQKRKSGKVKITKPPINPKTGELAKTNDLTTFGSFAEAKKAFKKEKYDGVGYVLTKNDKFIAVDIDNCIKNGKIIDPKAAKIINDLKTYTEISPSSKGLRCIALRGDNELTLKGNRVGNVELYSAGQYLTITGNPYEKKRAIRRCPKAFKKIHREEILSKQLKLPSDPKFQQLFAGDISGYSSQSEADLAFCGFLVRKGYDFSAIDEAFRNSGLMREKSHRREDYIERTIGKALKSAVPLKKSSKTAKIKFLDVKKLLSTEPPKTKWIIEDFISTGMIGEMIGDGKIGKSSLLLSMAICVATGGNIDPFKVSKPQKVMIINVEDPVDKIHERLRAQAKHYDCDKKLLRKNLLIADGFGKIGPLMKLKGGNPEPTEQGKKIKEKILKEKPALVILDTKSRLYGLEENNNDHATQWLFFLEKIVKKLGCSFVIAHHPSKGEGKTTGRGASAFSYNTRISFTLRLPSKKEGKRYKIENDVNNYFLLENFSNYSARTAPYCFRRIKAGIPIYINLEEQRWSQAEYLLWKELWAGKDITYQQLKRNEGEIAKRIREKLKNECGITQKELETLLDNLEKSGKITFEKTSRGRGKILTQNTSSQDYAN